MSISFVASTKIGGTNGGTTPGINTTGAKLIVIGGAYFGVSAGGPGIAISDSRGNTWTPLTERGPEGTKNVRFWYCLNPSVGTGHTFTSAGTGAIPAIFVTAWATTTSGFTFDVENGGTISGNGSFTVGAVTPTGAEALVLNAWSVTNSPTVTNASGWTVAESEPLVGGSNFGGGVAYQIQATATAVASLTRTSNWSLSDSSASATAVFREAAPTDSITLTSPVRYEVHQRSGTTGSIQISGTVSGATDDLEASFNGGAYVTIASAVAAGPFSGTLTGQAQGQGTLTVRKKTTTTTSATVLDVGIGDVFVVGGDSISEGRGTNAQSYTHATLKAAKFTQADAWGEGNDGIDTGTSNGSHWPLLATQIMASQGVPVAFISVGTGGTDVAGSANTWAKPGAEYTELTNQVTASTVTSVRGVLMHLGPNAVVNASTLSQATYNAAIDTLAANLAADVAGAPKLNLGIFGEVSTGSPPDRVAALNNLRAAIVEAIGDNANIETGPCLIDINYSDGVHPQSDADLQAVAARWWLALSETYYGGSGGRGPRLSSATWNAGRDQVTVTFDRALKTGLTHATACWAVSDNGTPMTVSSVAYHGSNPAALVITTSAAAVGANGTSRVTFAGGDTAVGVVVPRSADISMPVGSAVTIPAEPFYVATVNEVVLLSVTLDALVDESNAPRAAYTVDKVFAVRLSDNTVVAVKTAQTTNGSGVLPAFSDAALTAAPHLFVTWDDNETPNNAGAKVYTPS